MFVFTIDRKWLAVEVDKMSRRNLLALNALVLNSCSIERLAEHYLCTNYHISFRNQKYQLEVCISIFACIYEWLSFFGEKWTLSSIWYGSIVQLTIDIDCFRSFLTCSEYFALFSVKIFSNAFFTRITIKNTIIYELNKQKSIKRLISESYEKTLPPCYVVL